MRSKELALEFGCTPQYIRLLTKKAIESGKNYITLKNQKIFFQETIGRGGSGGKVYEYIIIDDIPERPKKKRVSVPKAIPEILPEINLEKPSVEDKMKIIDIYFKTRSSIRAVAKSYSIKSNGRFSAMSLEKRFKRWIKKFREQGIDGLVDKRGGKKSKVDWELFLGSLIQNGNLKTYFARYCYLYCKKHNLDYDVFEPKSNISYSTFAKFYNKHKDDFVVKAILNGPDALDRLEPVFRKRFDYPNQLWEIDATTIDLMLKVPVVDGGVSFFEKVESEEYVLKRFSLIGVVDRFSGARVYVLRKSDTSYSDVRLIEKAFNKLGVPEAIRGDNGKNYTSKHFQDVLKRLGVHYITSKPFAPEEKGGIEKGFKDIQHYHVFENLPGFIGHNPAQRIDIENQNSKKSKKKSGAVTNIKGELMWWWEAEEVIDGIINHLFGEKMKLHSEIAKSMKIENLHILLGKRENRKLQREGITYNGRLYVNPEIYNYFGFGEVVEVYEEIDDVGVIWAKVSENKFIKMVDESVANISVEEAKEAKRMYKKEHIEAVKQVVKSSWKSFEKMKWDNALGAKRKSEIKNEVKQVVVEKSDSNNSKELIDEFIEKFAYGS